LNGEARTARTKRSSPIIPPAWAIPSRHQLGSGFWYTLKAAAVRSLLAEYQDSRSAGSRLAGIAILHQFPNPSQLPWLAKRLDPNEERPFVGYAAAVALAQAVRCLPTTEYETLLKSINDALALARRNPHDAPRLNVLEVALKELEAKHAPGK
jgi:hypothetical protein